MAIQNPSTWGWLRLRAATQQIGAATADEYWHDARRHDAIPMVRRIGLADLRDALARGWRDFLEYRTDVIFLCVLYPLLGLLLARVASGYELLPLLFPLAAGFALLGPLAAVGLNEMSRRHEIGEQVGWRDAFQVLRAPSIGSIALLGFALIAIFLLWLVAAEIIFRTTLGPTPPATLAAFASDVLTTSAGWTMIALGCGIGFLFALLVLAISVVSFPLLLDRDIGINAAVGTSLRVMRANPTVIAAWGLIVAVLLVIGSLPLLLGLAIVLPVLGHATWHLYRKVIVDPR
jgi:uncharacterized membrane protein